MKCSLCLDSLNNGKWCITLICDHNLHLKCYQTLINNNGTRCPLCRVPLYHKNGIGVDISAENQLIMYYHGTRIVI